MTDASADPVPTPSITRLERHLQTVGIAVSTAGIMALAGIGWEMSHTMTQQQSELSSLSAAVNDVRIQIARTDQRFSDYMTRAESQAKFDAFKDSAIARDRRIDQLEQRVQR